MKTASLISPQNVVIVLPGHGKDYGEAAAILSHVLTDQGHLVDLTVEGHASIMNADVLILFGKFTAFTVSQECLRAARYRRPATIIWHIESLPPSPLPSRALDTAHLLSRCNWSLLPRPLAKLSQCIPGRTRLCRTARAILARRLEQKLELKAEFQNRVDPSLWHNAVRHYFWIQQNYSPQWCDLVAASTPSRCDVLRNMGIESTYAPLGYHPDWGYDRHGERDIEVLFLGHYRKNLRGPLLKELQHELHKMGITLTLVDRDCFGEDRTALINRTRILLDINKCVWEMPILRLLIGMACGALVISNWCGDPFPFTDEHLVRVPTQDLARTISYYLRHDSRRKILAAAGHQHVTEQLVWGPIVSRLLQTGLARHHHQIGANL